MKTLILCEVSLESSNIAQKSIGIVPYQIESDNMQQWFHKLFKGLSFAMIICNILKFWYLPSPCVRIQNVFQTLVCLVLGVNTMACIWKQGYNKDAN